MHHCCWKGMNKSVNKATLGREIRFLFQILISYVFSTKLTRVQIGVGGGGGKLKQLTLSIINN